MKSKIFKLTVALTLAAIIVACGGGGNTGRVMGTVTDHWGAPIGGDSITIVFSGIETIYHPHSSGNFDFSIPEGSYTVDFLWHDYDQAIGILATKNITVVKGQTVNLGNVNLTNAELVAGWAKYRGGYYYEAIDHFNSYLENVRSGQANWGSNSALVGLGWSYARLGKFLDAYNNLNAALTASNGTNIDALVGLGGVFLSVGYDGSSFIYKDAVIYLTSAINMKGDYSSHPTHDRITDTDLIAARALANFLDGKATAAKADISSARTTADTDGNFATLDTLNMLEWFIANM